MRGRQALAVSMASDIGVVGGAEAGSSPGVARPIRIGGQALAPGEARVVSLPLPGRADAADGIPVWAAVGRQPGPRATVVAALRGYEALAARCAESLRDRLDAETLAGSVAIAPVLRPGGRFAARGLPIADGVAWHFPGDPGGNRRAREAFAVFSELIVGSSLLVVLIEPEAGRLAMPVVRADLDDARLRRIATAAGATAVVHTRPVAGSLAAAARELGVATVEVMVGNRAEDVATAAAGAVELPGRQGGVHLLQALLAHLGVTRPSSNVVLPPSASIAITETVLVRAPSGGLVHVETAPGRIVERGGVLAHVAAPLSKRPLEIRSRHDVLVLETTGRTGVRGRGPLFLLGRVSRAVVARVARATGDRRRRPRDKGAALASVSLPGPVAVAPAGPELLRIGWVEAVSLPSLGVERLRAKIDTGARTSALHVTSMKVVGTTDGPHRRPILELTVPGGGRRSGTRPAPVRVQVRDYVLVKDTSGHTERRPVIETVLQLGSIQRRIRVTLTNRGDMLFPMLIGRTALGPDVLVDPTRRSLLRPPRRKKTAPPSRRAGSVLGDAPSS
jgi:predicted deacylase